MRTWQKKTPPNGDIGHKESWAALTRGTPRKYTGGILPENAHFHKLGLAGAQVRAALFIS